MTSTKCSAFVLKTMKQCTNNANCFTIDGIAVCKCHEKFNADKINEGKNLADAKDKRKQMIVENKNENVEINKNNFEVPLHDNLGNLIGVSYVSEEDYANVMTQKWHKHNKLGYVCGKNIMLHQFILGKAQDGYCIDHSNGNRLDNRRSNIRFISLSENSRNKQKKEGTTSQYIGVTLSTTANTWRVFCKINNIRNHIGSFKDEKEAAKAYDRHILVHCGEKAKTNGLVMWDDVKDKIDELKQAYLNTKEKRELPEGISIRKDGRYVVQIRSKNIKTLYFETRIYEEALTKLEEFIQIRNSIKNEIKNNVEIIPITRNSEGQAIITIYDYEIIVDDDNWYDLMKYKWHMKDEYATTDINCKKIRMHRYICGVLDDEKYIVDHANQIKTDNRKINLRKSTHGANNHNVDRKSNESTSKYKGVDYSKNDMKYRARISHDKKSIHIGYFVNETDAAIAYNEKAIELYGELANLNILETDDF